ncbi:MAG: FAD-binding oxidoreductase, partial [Myxococcales bacterium]|nr:FAD-binding oxidoreductase [Myxococcales bacterium]
PVSLTVSAEAGINGQHIEDHLNAAGLTLGHFPSSIMCSTLGGWLAARSAGQFSSRYGKIEDMVLGLKVATPDGAVLDTAERAPGAPDWTQLIVGSEGTLGVITEAVLKVQPLPEARRLRAYRFRHLADGLKGARAVMQAGLRPIVLRLYDPFDSLMAFGKDPEQKTSPRTRPFDAIRSLLSSPSGGAHDDAPAKKVPGFLAKRLEPWSKKAKHAAITTALSAPTLLNRLAQAAPSPCLMIVGFEGPAEAIHADAIAADELLTACGGVDAGARLGESWLEHRYAVSFKQSRLYQLGAFVDTMEVATTWDRLETLYHGVRSALSPHVFIMAHFSHAYREGCSIYFTFAGYRKDAARLEQHYERVWQLATDAVVANGGTVSHHHGVGLSKMAAMPREHGEMLRVWRALKDAIDPHGVMNPGKLFPDTTEVAAGSAGGAARSMVRS